MTNEERASKIRAMVAALNGELRIADHIGIDVNIRINIMSGSTCRLIRIYNITETREL